MMSNSWGELPTTFPPVPGRHQTNQTSRPCRWTHHPTACRAVRGVVIHHTPTARQTTTATTASLRMPTPPGRTLTDRAQNAPRFGGGSCVTGVSGRRPAGGAGARPRRSCSPWSISSATPVAHMHQNSAAAKSASLPPTCSRAAAILASSRGCGGPGPPRRRRRRQHGEYRTARYLSTRPGSGVGPSGVEDGRVARQSPRDRAWRYRDSSVSAGGRPAP